MNLLRKYEKTPEKTAVVSALTVGVITHLFAIVTILSNFDDVANQPGGFGIGVQLGRWFLEILGRLMGKLGLGYNLPVVNSLVFLLLLSVSAGFLISVLQIKNRWFAGLLGGLFIVFPTVTATLFYRYTIPYYGIGVLLSVLAVWVLRRSRWGLLWSSLALCLSMGIYQAYAPITIALFVLQLIRQSLNEETQIRALVRSGLYDCLALILGVALYFLVMRLSIRGIQEDLIAYQGVETMGQLSLADLLRLIRQAYGRFFGIAFADHYSVSPRKLIRLAYLGQWLLTAGLLVMTLANRRKKPVNALATLVLCALFPLAVNFMEVMCPDSWIYTLMVYAFALIPCLPMILAEELRTEGGKTAAVKLTGLAAAFLVFCYGYYDNVNYSALYYANRQVENYVNSITVQVRMTEGFTPDKKWAMLGQIEDPLLKSHWDEESSYGGNSYAHHLLINYSRNEWFENYVGYEIPTAEPNVVEALIQNAEVKSMPCWPNEGSIRVIDDTVVIKFQELAQ